MHEHQNPMTGFKLLEQAFSQGFRMRPVPGTEDLFVEIDQGLRSERYTYANLKGLQVQQLVVLDGVSRSTTCRASASSTAL